MNNLNTSAETLLFQKTHIFFHQINPLQCFITYNTNQSKSFSTVPFPGIPPKTPLTNSRSRSQSEPQRRNPDHIEYLLLLYSCRDRFYSRAVWRGQSEMAGCKNCQQRSTLVMADLSTAPARQAARRAGGRATEPAECRTLFVVVSHARFPPFTLCFNSVCHSCLHRCDLLRCGESGMGERKRW